MDTFTTLLPDFSEAVDFDDAQIPPGVYKARVDSWEKKTSKKGEDYLSWKLVIFGAEGDLVRQNNRPVYMITMLRGPGAGKLKELLKSALGELPSAFEPGWQDTLIGKELQIALTKNIRPDGTEGFPNVKSVKPLEH